MFVSVFHQSIQVVVVLAVGQIRLCAQQVAGDYVADVPAIRVGNELVVLYAIHVTVLCVEFGNYLGILGGETFETSRDDCYYEVLGGLYALS